MQLERLLGLLWLLIYAVPISTLKTGDQNALMQFNKEHIGLGGRESSDGTGRGTEQRSASVELEKATKTTNSRTNS